MASKLPYLNPDETRPGIGWQERFHVFKHLGGVKVSIGDGDGGHSCSALLICKSTLAACDLGLATEEDTGGGEHGEKVTWDVDAIDGGVFDAVQEGEDVGHLCCRHVLSFPSVKKQGYFKCCVRWPKPSQVPT